jgi:hypothetical protein
MNETEELLRLTLYRHAEDAPFITTLREGDRPSRRLHLRWGPPLAAAGVAVVLVVGVAWLDNDPTGTSTPTAATYQEVKGLTGEDVGLALGLKPITDWPIEGCDDLVEYKPRTAFCLEGVPGDPVELRVLSMQIQGYVRNDALVAYAKLYLEFRQFMRGGGPNDQSEWDQFHVYQDRLRILDQQLIRLGERPDDATLYGRLVTDASQLDATWTAQSLFGKAVTQPSGKGSNPVDVTFRTSAAGRWWNTDDGCNATGGKFVVKSSGQLVTHLGASTLVGCPQIPAARQHAANVGAIEAANEARITHASGGSQTLTLLSNGEIVGVYSMLIGSE